MLSNDEGDNIKVLAFPENLSMLHFAKMPPIPRLILSFLLFHSANSHISHGVQHFSIQGKG